MDINNEIEIIEKNLLDSMKVSPRYITFRCNYCGKVWGVNVEGNSNYKLKIHDLACRDCLIKKNKKNN